MVAKRAKICKNAPDESIRSQRIRKVLPQRTSKGPARPSKMHANRHLTVIPSLFAGEGTVRRFDGTDQPSISRFLAEHSSTSAFICGDTEKVMSRLPDGIFQSCVTSPPYWDALGEALGQLDPNITKKQILTYVPAGAQKILAQAGIRDEHVFPVPAVLEKKPTLVGYYRLLLGISQKRFYRKGTDMGPFKAMETRGVLNPKKRPDLEHFCTVMAGNLAELVSQISPRITARDISELPLLMLGAQLYGSNNNAIGRQATREIFLSVAEIAGRYIASRDAAKLWFGTHRSEKL